ncbi:hypothetical protein BC567DRAFT_260119 [Phyllosticta citribraziliensis]
MPTVAYAYDGTENGFFGCWTTRYNVDVNLQESFINDPTINGPDAGQRECIIGMTLNDWAAIGYPRNRHTREPRLERYRCVYAERPSTIRLFRANRAWNPRMRVPQRISTNLLEVPLWALQQCEITELNITYWDGGYRPLPPSPMTAELFFPNVPGKRTEIWFYYDLDLRPTAEI